MSSPPISFHISIRLCLLHWHLSFVSPSACRLRAGGRVCAGDTGELGTPLRFSRFLSPQVFGFFKGMSFPLASIAVYNSVVFGVFSNTQRFLGQHRSREPEAGPPRNLSDLILASMVAGVVSVGLGTPVDLIKIRLQMQTQPFRESKRPGKGLVSGRGLMCLIWGAGITPFLLSGASMWSCHHP